MYLVLKQNVSFTVIECAYEDIRGQIRQANFSFLISDSDVTREPVDLLSYDSEGIKEHALSTHIK
jgi:hypothetical protein